MRFLYHGTTADNLPSILKYGLTGKLDADDDWSGNFVTTDPIHARDMAKDMRREHRGKGKIIVLRINPNHPCIKGARLDHGTAGAYEHGARLSDIMRHPAAYFSFRLNRVSPEAIIEVIK